MFCETSQSWTLARYPPSAQMCPRSSQNTTPRHARPTRHVRVPVTSPPRRHVSRLRHRRADGTSHASHVASHVTLRHVTGCESLRLRRRRGAHCHYHMACRRRAVAESSAARRRRRWRALSDVRGAPERRQWRSGRPPGTARADLQTNDSATGQDRSNIASSRRVAAVGAVRARHMAAAPRGAPDTAARGGGPART